jgi:hypothetical protein
VGLQACCWWCGACSGAPSVLLVGWGVQWGSKRAAGGVGRAVGLQKCCWWGCVCSGRTDGGRPRCGGPGCVLPLLLGWGVSPLAAPGGRAANPARRYAPPRRSLRVVYSPSVRRAAVRRWGACGCAVKHYTRERDGGCPGLSPNAKSDGGERVAVLWVVASSTVGVRPRCASGGSIQRQMGPGRPRPTRLQRASGCRLLDRGGSRGCFLSFKL